MKKECRKCYKIKDISEFGRYKKNADGYKSWCRKCENQYKLKWKWGNIERHRNCARISAKEIRKTGGLKKYNREWKKKWRTSEKIKAHNMVKTRLADKGKTPKECSICKIPCKPIAHHKDYSFPLDVVWCCHPCHKAIHLERVKWQT